MFRQPYTLDEVHFAYAYHLYIRCHTYRWQPAQPLATLTKPILQQLVERHNIHVLSTRSDSRELVAITSLRPSDSASAAVSKTKGSVSKWLREQSGSHSPKLLGDGYFACTSGNSNREKVEAYLGTQSTHHGYDQRAIPPVFGQRYRCPDTAEVRLQPKHARALLRFHIVFATMGRKGVFGRESGPRIAASWQALGETQGFLLEKVSFVPDHVHLALRLHPTAKPAEVVLGLLNDAEVLMHREFPEHLIQAGGSRLWQPSAYMGAYGNVTSATVKKYISHWRGRR